MSYAYKHRKKLIKRKKWDFTAKRERDARQGRFVPKEEIKNV